MGTLQNELYNCIYWSTNFCKLKILLTPPFISIEKMSAAFWRSPLYSLQLLPPDSNHHNFRYHQEGACPFSRNRIRQHALFSVSFLAFRIMFVRFICVFAYVTCVWFFSFLCGIPLFGCLLIYSSIWQLLAFGSLAGMALVSDVACVYSLAQGCVHVSQVSSKEGDCSIIADTADMKRLSRYCQKFA